MAKKKGKAPGGKNFDTKKTASKNRVSLLKPVPPRPKPKPRASKPKPTANKPKPGGKS